MTTPIQLVAKDHNAQTGIGRYAHTLHRGLVAAGIPVTLHTPRYPFPAWTRALPQRFGYDLDAFFRSYPLAVERARGEIVHLTTQSLGTIPLLQRLSPLVITVHDILSYLLRDVPGQSLYRHGLERALDGWAMRGLQRADALVADSAYSRQTVIDTLKIAPDRISVVHLGIDHAVFTRRPARTDAAARAGMTGDHQYMLYVGAESPRKNLSTLIDAFAQIARDLPHVRLIKGGAAHDSAGRARLTAQIAARGLTDRVIFVESLAEDALVDLYNQVDVAVQPSLYEGFGFPVLEAMACGTPVVCSNTTSLPELAGDAALSVSPHDAEAMADALRRVLTDSALAADLRARGMAQAAAFTWARTVEQTLDVYRRVGALT
jgi:glycosyltransferase involved in cell wall biosynthesis